MPEGTQVTAPNVLPEAAQILWRAAFDDSYAGSCKSKAVNNQREACSAKSAWDSVKEMYRKIEGGEWVERTFVERGLKAGDAPLPGSLYESPASAGLLWIRAYDISMDANQDIAESASRAWDKLKEKYTTGAEGVWEIRNDVTIEPEPAGSEEVEMAEPIVNRSVEAGASYQMEGTSILAEDVAYEDFEAIIDRYGDEAASRPADWPWENWGQLPMTSRTVRAVLNHRLECRAVEGANDLASKRGWTGTMNKNGSGEVIFRGWNNVGDTQRTFSNMVLVSKIGAGTQVEDWEMQILSNLQSGTLMARVAPGYKRFRGPVIK